MGRSELCAPLVHCAGSCLSDAEIVAALPKSLRYVVSIAAGYDKIDWEACGKRNILVSHCGALPGPAQR